MSEYTPTTPVVRAAYIQEIDAEVEESFAQFDRWLASVKAEAWDECGRELFGDDYDDSETSLRNPYRGEQA